MGTFILIILFYLFLAFVSFVIVYANDIADIANNDFETYEPSIRDLSEEERTSICTVDYYIKNTVCPRYHHQILRNEINIYQNNEFSFSFFLVNLCCSGILIKALGVEKWIALFLLVTIIIGYACYFVVWLLYKHKKHSTIRITSYYEIHSSYDWESHYKYLLSIKKNVVFRYMLRNTFEWLSLLCFVFTIAYGNI